ncbi:MAG: ABC transporter ATP-binding protein [Chloroflexi bacterium]|nr:ABC transporter ATP-binding protein [Chloroflexota bacterium]
MNQDQMLLEVRNLKTYFFLEEGTVHAIDGADFAIGRGEALGVVGESGCGKSVTGQSILRIVPYPGRVVEGEIIFYRYNKRPDGTEVQEAVNLTALDPQGEEIRSIRGGEIAMVFQEPMTSLSPVHTMGQQIMEAIILHQGVDKAEARRRAIDMLRRVGMPQPETTVDSYPHQMSGGMRQRGMIAMALSCSPSLLIADEPTTAIDVTTQAQILQLMRDLQEDLGMAIMFITHDLGVIAEMTKRVVVMYMGRVVESASVDDLYYDPKHPYTRALLNSIPRLGQQRAERLESIKGVVPDPYNLPPGCPFHPRCNSFMPGVCDVGDPMNIEVGPGHEVRCFLYNE